MSYEFVSSNKFEVQVQPNSDEILFCNPATACEALKVSQRRRVLARRREGPKLTPRSQPESPPDGVSFLEALVRKKTRTSPWFTGYA